MSKVGDGNYTICSGAIQYAEWTSSQYDDIRGIRVCNLLYLNGSAQSTGAIGFYRTNNDQGGGIDMTTPRVRPFLAF